ncbi:MAG: hypothetical protein H6511_00585 [Holophagales bacterium]|nr:hypothetical protein [Myxococcales bacterium]MCB9377245.1 hypothetical protein [Holophagales bacterium]
MSSRPRGSKRSSPRRESRAGEESASASSLPSLRFHHSEELRAETLDLLARLDAADDPTDLVRELSDLVSRLTASGLDYYFMLPLREARAGFMVERSAALGISSALRVMEPLLRGVLGRLKGDQLRVVCRHVRGMMG